MIGSLFTSGLVDHTIPQVEQDKCLLLYTKMPLHGTVRYSGAPIGPKTKPNQFSQHTQNFIFNFLCVSIRILSVENEMPVIHICI